MEGIINDIAEHGLRSTTLDDLLKKLKNTLDEAYTAAENENEYTALTKVGESKVYIESIMAIWSKLTEPVKQ